MPFKKGQSGNPSGRKPGVKNANKPIINGLVRYLADGQTSKFKEEFNKLKGETYIKYFFKLCQLANVDISDEYLNCKLIEVCEEIIKNKSK